MKRVLSVLLFVALLMSLTACGSTSSGSKKQCDHEFYLSDYRAATETENGASTYTCKFCQFSYTEVLPATGPAPASAPSAEPVSEPSPEPVYEPTPEPEPEPSVDYKAAARGQGIDVPDEFVPSYPEGKFVTIYSNDRDFGIFGKSRPEDGREYRLTKLNYPVNVYIFGTYNKYTLIKTENESYYFIPSNIFNIAPISCDPSSARRGEGLLELIEQNGIVIPDTFVPSDVQVGELRNEKTNTYAIYKYADPKDAGTESESFGLFYFPCAAKEKTKQYDGRVEIFGSYNGLSLMHSVSEEFFWAGASFFKIAS